MDFFELFDAIMSEAEFQLSIHSFKPISPDWEWSNADRRYFVQHYAELVVETRA